MTIVEGLLWVIVLLVLALGWFAWEMKDLRADNTRLRRHVRTLEGIPPVGSVIRPQAKPGRWRARTPFNQDQDVDAP